MRTLFKFEWLKLYRSRILYLTIVLIFFIPIGYFFLQKTQHSQVLDQFKQTIFRENQMNNHDLNTYLQIEKEAEKKGKSLEPNQIEYIKLLKELNQQNQKQIAAIQNQNHSDFLNARKKWLEQQQKIPDFRPERLFNKKELEQEKESLTQLEQTGSFYELSNHSLIYPNGLILFLTTLLGMTGLTLLVLYFQLPVFQEFEQRTYYLLFSEIKSPHQWMLANQMLSLLHFCFFLLMTTLFSGVVQYFTSQPLLAKQGRNDWKTLLPHTQSIMLSQIAWAQIIFGCLIFLFFVQLLWFFLIWTKKSLISLLLFLLCQLIFFLGTTSITSIQQWWNPYFMIQSLAYVTKYPTDSSLASSLLTLCCMIPVLFTLNNCLIKQK